MNQFPENARSAPQDGTPVGDSPHAIDWPVRAGAVDDVLREMAIRVASRRRRQRRLVTTAMTASLMICLGGYLLTQRVKEPAPSAAAPAIVSQPERRALPDGSVVELKPGARVLIQFTDTERRVRLEEGEAHFDVASDPGRPFIVVAGEVEFRAVGTAFSVQRTANAVELLVTQGRVTVDKPAVQPTGPQGASGPTSAPPPPLAVVDAGSRVVVPIKSGAVAPKVETLAAAEIRERTAWRVPLLELSGTPLGEAARIFSRHSGTQLVLVDAELAQVRLSGMLRADNVETLLSLLEESRHVRIERRNAHEILLHRR